MADEILEFKNEDLFDFGEDENVKPSTENTKQIKDFDLNKYSQEQLKEEKTKKLKERTEEEEWKNNNFPSFETIMNLKAHYKNISLVEIGDQLEDSIFHISPKMYIIKPLPQAKYMHFVENVGSISSNMIAFNKFCLEECVLYPELDSIDIEELSIADGDMLINEINKCSRYSSTKSIIRV